MILPALAQEDTVCDFGCGLGRIDLELSPFVRHLTAIDQSQAVIDQLAQDAAKQGLQNLSAVCADACQSDKAYDVGIMSFFGRSGRELQDYRKQCRKKLVRIVNQRAQSTLYPAAYRTTTKDTADVLRQELAHYALSYTSFEAHLQFGQPLRSLEDAAAFVRFQAPGITSKDTASFLKASLQPTADDTFLFYLPNTKHLQIFIIA